jgi:hypothetical protein
MRTFPSPDLSRAPPLTINISQVLHDLNEIAQNNRVRNISTTDSLNPLQPRPKGSMSTQGSEGLKRKFLPVVQLLS